MGKRTPRLLAALAILALVATACDTGGDTDGTDGDGAGETEDGESRTAGDLIVGTTDTVTSVDPARVYDYYSSNILFNVGETLVGFEPGETEVSPRLAEEVEISDDGLTYTFTLREGVTFHDGSTLDSEDVRFSLERAIDMNHPQGAAFLIAGIDTIETPDEQTVELTLAEPNITFLSRLAYTVATIVPSDGDYTAPESPIEVEGDDEEDTEAAEQEAEEFVNEDLVATGPYRLEEFREGESITLEAFEDYWGDAPANDRVLIQFFQTSSQMKLALESGEIDVAFRDLSPDERQDLEGAEGIQLVEGEGASIRYIVFNTLLEPGDDVNVRKAVAAAIDRERIVEDVFAGAAEPLYSMIPPGFDESVDYFSAYEDDDPATHLEGIDTPVEIDLHYGGERYGPTEPSLAQVIQRTLEETDLFEVNLTSTEWAQFTEEAWPGEDGQYPVFLLGWYPDYFDADDYIEPFYASDGFLGFYDNDAVDELIAEEQQVTDAASEERQEIFDQIQEIVADEAPIIPMFVQTPFVFASDDVTGLEETMDPVQIFRYYLLSKE
ncbi:MAG TPA: ABC transporter substrate-binding protein [Egibacteraceae bacterium]|nr:ABC transporter substrate-binding protein [Egibacteraceae bacterium]